MRLIGSITSPFVRKVRVVLSEKKLDYQFVRENVWATDTQITAYNPLGKVPCLLTDNDDALYDSHVIVEYLDTLSPVGKLIPAAGRERAQVRTWEALADGMLDAAILARLEATWPGRNEGERSQAWIDRQMGKIDASLVAMADGLGDKAWCVDGTHATLADIAVGCALAYLDFRFPELTWRRDHENLAELLDARLMPRASFIDTTPE